MRLISFTLAVCMTAWFSALASAEDAPKRSAELQVLERFIGDWTTVVTAKGKEGESTSIESRRWSREGTFVLSENRDVATKKEAHFMITYDSKNKLYRACFISDEFTVPFIGAWDEKSQIMKWASADVPFKHRGVHRFLDKDNVVWTMTITSPEGKVVLELSAKQTRRKK